VRVHRDGSIQARRFEVALSSACWHCAINVGMYRTEGVTREIERNVGVSIEGALRVRNQASFMTDSVLVTVESDWVSPTRS